MIQSYPAPFQVHKTLERITAKGRLPDGILLIFDAYNNGIQTIDFKCGPQLCNFPAK